MSDHLIAFTTAAAGIGFAVYGAHRLYRSTRRGRHHARRPPKGDQ